MKFGMRKASESTKEIRDDDLRSYIQSVFKEGADVTVNAIVCFIDRATRRYHHDEIVSRNGDLYRTILAKADFRSAEKTENGNGGKVDRNENVRVVEFRDGYWIERTRNECLERRESAAVNIAERESESLEEMKHMWAKAWLDGRLGKKGGPKKGFLSSLFSDILKDEEGENAKEITGSDIIQAVRKPAENWNIKEESEKLKNRKAIAQLQSSAGLAENPEEMEREENEERASNMKSEEKIKDEMSGVEKKRLRRWYRKPQEVKDAELAAKKAVKAENAKRREEIKAVKRTEKIEAGKAKKEKKSIAKSEAQKLRWARAREAKWDQGAEKNQKPETEIKIVPESQDHAAASAASPVPAAPVQSASVSETKAVVMETMPVPSFVELSSIAVNPQEIQGLLDVCTPKMVCFVRKSGDDRFAQVGASERTDEKGRLMWAVNKKSEYRDMDVVFYEFKNQKGFDGKLTWAWCKISESEIICRMADCLKTESRGRN